MTNHNYTPEEKLLSLIKGQKNPVSASDPAHQCVSGEAAHQCVSGEAAHQCVSREEGQLAQQSTPRGEAIPRGSSTERPEREESTPRGSSPRSPDHPARGERPVREECIPLEVKQKFTFSLPGSQARLSTDKILFVCFAVSCLCLAGSFLYPRFALKDIKAPRIDTQGTQLKFPNEKKPFAFYQEVIGQHNIFVPSAQAQPAKPLGVVNGDLVKDITLVGIISGATPQAIIEDKKTGKSYYVSKGQSIGELQVEEILEGKIILNVNGEKYELYL